MLGIISDIHGNFIALNSVIKEIKKLGCTGIISLGDVAGYGCMINECIDLLREENVIAIKGNHDSYLLGEGNCNRSYSANFCIEYQKKIIRGDNIAWMRNLPDIVENKDFVAVHGDLRDKLDGYNYDFDFKELNNFKYTQNIFFSGHTHIQKLKVEGEKKHCNPGSVGQPRDYDNRAAFAIMDEQKRIFLYRVSYDIEKFSVVMDKAGFDRRFYSNLFSGSKIGEKVNVHE